MNGTAGMLLSQSSRCRQSVRWRCCRQVRCLSADSQRPPPWRPGSVLDDWVERDVRPISLRQLTFFGRTLTESRLISSANYVRTELPTRIAHRLRDMQKLPYVVVTNPHLSYVYELYYKAFERFRTVPEIKTIEDNDRYCDILRHALKEHLTVIPNLAMGVLECQDLVKPDVMDRFMNTLLRARISRRVIAEQHLALTETFNSPWHFPDSSDRDMGADFVGEVFLKYSLSSRPPNLRLGMGLPMSRVYAEYWAGTLELHSLEGYGVDAFLQISRLGNQNEQVSKRAAIDAV
ncbi:hypothetical protein TEQG_03099 [Trichophyton equinum CBS 127.97]|uniref:Protein-serine/threonine kinase n=1 Tax=Trichophyton equinum (strain ATCC MYA-4606 / CBS 127.97) TaxID=559882 RepID=F2PQ99_TRIEC|nr:hypothetical protein TEQG_03099 [Trichophyton equinum CBS 127.97]